MDNSWEDTAKTIIWGTGFVLFYCWLVYDQKMKKAKRAQEEREAEAKLRTFRGEPAPAPTLPATDKPETE